MIMRSAGESSSVTISPGAWCTTVICEASHAISAGETSERTGIAASCCASVVVEVSISHLSQMAVYELNGDRAFAHSGRDPLHRAVPDVSHGEHAGDARFEHKRVAVYGPTRRPLAVAH